MDVYVVGIRSMVGVRCDRRVLVITEVCDFCSAGVEYMVDPGSPGEVGCGSGNIPLSMGNCEEC